MKKISMMLILVLNFICFAEEYTYMSYEEAEKILNYYNSPTFPKYYWKDNNDETEPSGLLCKSEPINHSIDSVDSKYVHYSLANCNGKNYVSNIKQQIGGNCPKWAVTAAIETKISTLLDNYIDYIQPSVTKWSPVDLSEAWTTVTTENRNNNNTVLTKMLTTGTVHDYYFPFYNSQDKDVSNNLLGWISYWDEIKAYNYVSPECNTETYAINNRFDYTDNISECMFHEAKNRNAVVVYPTEKNAVEIRKCVNNKVEIDCPVNTPYGGINDPIQPDYYEMEQGVKQKLMHGIPVLLSFNWNVQDIKNSPIINTNLGYDFILTTPKPLTDFKDGINQNDNKVKDERTDVIDQNTGIQYNFQSNHAVVIIGYLENRCWDLNNNGECDKNNEDINGDGRCTPRDCPQTEFDYFIIKNSHGNDIIKFLGHSNAFNIIRVPSSFYSVKDDDSTQRLIHSFTMGKNLQYLPSPTTMTIAFDDIDFKQIAGFDNNGNVIAKDVPEKAKYDGDGDGIPDFVDNCPAHSNPDQKDSDGDGVGDVCDNCYLEPNPEQRDADGDGVGNECDNCLDTPNKMEINNSEIVVAPCDSNGVGGAFCMGLNSYKDADGNYWWQPDHNLNGTGDACDIYPAVWTEFSGIPTGTSVENGITYQDKNLKVVSMKRNETLSVTIDMNVDMDKTLLNQLSIGSETSTTRYCWITTDEFDRGVWGTDGHCTTEAGHTKGACETNFGYSHGSDPEPVIFNKPAWKFINKKKDNPEEGNEFTEIKIEKDKRTGAFEGLGAIDWDWRYDLRTDEESFENALTTAPECTNFSLGVCQDANVPKFYYTMSTGVHDTDPKYLTSQNEINPNFFKNKQKYARSSRLTLFPVVISYHSTPVPILAPIKYCTGRCDFILEEYQEMIINELINGPRPYEMPGMDHYFKNDYGSDLINRGVSFREWSNNAAGMPSVSEKNRPMYLATISKNAGGTNVGLVAKSNDATQLRDMKASSGVTFEIAEMDINSNGDWRTKGILEDVPAGFAPTASVYHNGNLYVVSSNGNEEQVYEIKSTGQTVTPTEGNNICFVAVPIFTPIHIGTLTNISNITLLSLGNSLIALGKGGNGMEVYKFSEKGFENITGTNMPQIRDVYNVEVKDGVLYLAGGAELSKDSVDLKTDFWSFCEADGWQIVRDDLNLFPLTLRIDFDGDKIILTNRAIRHNATTERAIFNADGSGEITLETIKVEGAPVQKYEESFCISETDKTIFPGITNFYGECVKVENYDFNEVTFPDYKLSVAGYKNSLYLGGLSGIRRVEIGENGEITKKEMIYSGESNNLAVYGNTLYAANYSEIDIFEIADDGVIQRKSSVKTSNCKNIRIDGGKLFAAENKRVRIFDLNDPLSPELLKTISFSNTVEDLEIAENKLFVYENLNGLLTRKGKVSVFDVSDIANPQKIKEFSQYCNDPEMQKSGNSVYLGCKNGSFKVEETGLQKVNGSKNYLREGYVFDGILYQVFSGTLHESSVESDEIEEDGWF